MKLMQQLNLSNDARSVLAILCGVTAAIVFALIWFGVSQWQRYDDVLDSVGPRVARLQGILLASQDTAAAMEGIAASVSRYAYPPQGDLARVESDFHSRARDILQGTGLQIVNTQQLPARNGDGYDEINLTLSASGSMPQLIEALTLLRAEMPRIRIEQLRLQPMMRGGNAPEAQSLTMQLNLAAIRLREI